MKQPAVSICIPTYNYGRYIGEAVESVLAQSFDDFEFIIIDDCSDDETEAIVNHYKEINSSIKFFKNEKNVGMVNNWNLCLNAARGKYVKFLFADDKLISNDAIRIMYDALEANESAVMACSARVIIDESSKPTGVWSCLRDDVLVRGSDMIRQCVLEQRNIIGEPTAVMFRREIGTRGFDPSFRQLVDLEMWLHLLTHGNLVYLSKPLVAFRQHCEQQSEVNSRTGICLHEMSRITLAYLSDVSNVREKVLKHYLLYSYCHKIWKAFRSGGMPKTDVHGIINNHLKLGLFYVYMPLYKIISPFYKLLAKNRRKKISFNKLTADLRI